MARRQLAENPDQMAQAVAETEMGRALLLNAAMLQADWGRLLGHNEIFSLIFERWPHYVHYRGRGKPIHCPPDTFGFIGKPGPSHCDWIVPGTL